MYDKEVKKIIKDAINSKKNSKNPIAIAKQIRSKGRELYKQKKNTELKKQNTRDHECYQAIRTEIVEELFRFVSADKNLPANLAVEVLAELSKDPSKKVRSSSSGKSQMDYTVDAYLQQILKENTKAERMMNSLAAIGLDSSGAIKSDSSNPRKVPKKINDLDEIEENSAKDLEQFIIKSGIMPLCKRDKLVGDLFTLVDKYAVSKITAAKILLTLSKCQSKSGYYQRYYSFSSILSYAISDVKTTPGHAPILKEIFRQCGLTNGRRSAEKVIKTCQEFYKSYSKKGKPHRFPAEEVFNDMSAMVEAGALSLEDAAAFIRGFYHQRNNISNPGVNGSVRARIVSVALKLSNSSHHTDLVNELFRQMKTYESKKRYVSSPTGIVRCMYDNIQKTTQTVNPRNFIDDILTLQEKGIVSKEELLRDFEYIVNNSTIGISAMFDKHLRDRCQKKNDNEHSDFLSELSSVASVRLDQTKTAIISNFSRFNTDNSNEFFNAIKNSKGGDDLFLITENSIIAHSKKYGLDATLKLLSDKIFLEDVKSDKKIGSILTTILPRLYAAHHEDESSLKKIMKILTDNVGDYRKFDIFTGAIYKIGIMASVKGEKSKREFFYDVLGEISSTKPLTYKYMLNEINKVGEGNVFLSNITYKDFSDGRKQAAIDRYKAVLPKSKLEKYLNGLIPKMFDPKTPRDQIALIKRNLIKKNNKKVDDILFGFNRSPYLDRYNRIRIKQDGEKAVKDMIALVDEGIISQKEAGNILASLCQGIKEKKLIITEALFNNSADTQGIIKEFFGNVIDAAEAIFNLEGGIKSKKNMLDADYDLRHLGDLSTEEVVKIYSHFASKGQTQANIVSAYVIDAVIKRNYNENLKIAKEFFKKVGDIYSTLYVMHQGFSSVDQVSFAVGKVIELARIGVITNKEARDTIKKFYTNNTDESDNKVIHSYTISSMNKKVATGNNIEDKILLPLYKDICSDDMAKSFMTEYDGLKNKDQVKRMISDLIALAGKNAIKVSFAVEVLGEIYNNGSSIRNISDVPLLKSALKEKLKECSAENDFKSFVVKKIISDIYIDSTSAIQDFDNFFKISGDLYREGMIDIMGIVSKLSSVYLKNKSTIRAIKLIKDLSKKAETSPLAKNILKNILISIDFSKVVDNFAESSDFINCLCHEQVIDLAMDDKKVADCLATAISLGYQHSCKKMKNGNKNSGNSPDEIIRKWSDLDKKIRENNSNNSQIDKINILSNKVMSAIVEVENGQYSSRKNMSKKLISENFDSRADTLKFVNYGDLYKKYNKISNQYDADNLVERLIGAMDKGEISAKVAADILYYCSYSTSIANNQYVDSYRGSRIMHSLMEQGKQFDSQEYYSEKKYGFLKMRYLFYKNCQENCQDNEKSLLDGLYDNKYGKLNVCNDKKYGENYQNSQDVINDFFNLSHNYIMSNKELVSTADAVSAVIYLFEKNSSDYSGIISAIMDIFSDNRKMGHCYFSTLLLEKVLNNQNKDALIKKAFCVRYENLSSEKFFNEIAVSVTWGKNIENFNSPVEKLTDILVHVFRDSEKDKNKDSSKNIDMYEAIYNACIDISNINNNNEEINKSRMALAKGLFSQLSEEEIADFLKRVVESKNNSKSGHSKEKSTIFGEISFLVDKKILEVDKGVKIITNLIKKNANKSAGFHKTMSDLSEIVFNDGHQNVDPEIFPVLKGVFSSLTKEEILDLVNTHVCNTYHDEENDIWFRDHLAIIDIFKLVSSGLIDDDKMFSIIVHFCKDEDRCREFFYNLVNNIESDERTYAELAEKFVTHMGFKGNESNSSKTFFKNALYEGSNKLSNYKKAESIINKLIKSERLGILALEDVEEIISSFCRDGDSINNVCKALINHFKSSPSKENISIIKHVFSHLAKEKNEEFKKSLFDIMLENKSNQTVVNMVCEVLKKDCLPKDRESILLYLINGEPSHGTIFPSTKTIEADKTNEYRKIICDLVINVYEKDNDNDNFNPDDSVIANLSRYLIQEFLEGNRGSAFSLKVANLLSSNGYQNKVMMELYTMYASRDINHDKILELIDCMVIAKGDDSEIVTRLEELVEKFSTYQKGQLISDLFCYSIKRNSDSFPYIKKELINLSKLNNEKKDINIGKIMLDVVDHFNQDAYDCSNEILARLDGLAVDVYQEMSSFSKDKIEELFELMEKKTLSAGNIAEIFFQISKNKGKDYKKQIKSFVSELVNIYKDKNKNGNNKDFNEKYFQVIKNFCKKVEYNEANDFISQIYLELRSEPSKEISRAIGDGCVSVLLSLKDEEVSSNKSLSNEALLKKARDINKTLLRKGVLNKTLLEAINREVELRELSSDSLNELNERLLNNRISNKELTDELVVVILSLKDEDLISQILLNARKDLFDKVVMGLDKKILTSVLLNLNERLFENVVRSIFYSCCTKGKVDYQAICDVLIPLLDRLPENERIVKKLMTDLSNNPNITKNKGFYKIIFGALNHCRENELVLEVIEDIIISISFHQDKRFDQMAGDYMISLNGKSNESKLISDKNYQQAAKGILIKLGKKGWGDKKEKKGFFKMLLNAAKDGNDATRFLVKGVVSSLLFGPNDNNSHALSLIDRNFESNIEQYLLLRNENNLLKESEKKILDEIIADSITAGNVENIEQANLAISNMNYFRSLPGMNNVIDGEKELDDVKILFQAFFTSGKKEFLDKIDSYKLKVEQLIECSMNNDTSFPKGDDDNGYTIGGVRLDKHKVNRNKKVFSDYLSEKIYGEYVKEKSCGNKNVFGKSMSLKDSLIPDMRDDNSEILSQAMKKGWSKFHKRADIAEVLEDINDDSYGNEYNSNIAFSKGENKAKNFIFTDCDDDYDDGYGSFDDEDGQDYTAVLVDMIIEKAEENGGVIDEKHLKLLCQLDNYDLSRSRKFFSSVIDRLKVRNELDKEISKQMLSEVLAKSSANDIYRELLSSKLSPDVYIDFVLFHANRLKIKGLNKPGKDEKNILAFFKRILMDKNKNYKLLEKLTNKLIDIMKNNDHSKLISKEIIELFSHVLDRVSNSALSDYIYAELINTLKVKELRDEVCEKIISSLGLAMKANFYNNEILYTRIVNGLVYNFYFLNPKSKKTIMAMIKYELEKGDLNGCSAMLDLCCRFFTKECLVGGGDTKQLLSLLIAGFEMKVINEQYDKICGNAVNIISDVFVSLKKPAERDLITKAIKDKLSAGKKSSDVRDSRSYKMMLQLCYQMISKVNLTRNESAKEIVSLLTHLFKTKENNSDYSKSLQRICDRAIATFIAILQDGGDISYDIRPDIIKGIEEIFTFLGKSNQKNIIDMVADGLKSESGPKVNATMLQVACGKSFIEMMRDTLKEEKSNDEFEKQRYEKVVSIGKLLCSEKCLKDKGDELLDLFNYTLLNKNNSNNELCDAIFNGYKLILVEKDSDKIVCKKVISNMVALLKNKDIDAGIRAEVIVRLKAVLASNLGDGKAYLYDHTITELANKFDLLSTDNRDAIIDMVKEGLDQVDNANYCARLVKLCAKLSSAQYLTGAYADKVLDLMRTVLKTEQADGLECANIIKNILLNYHQLTQQNRKLVVDMVKEVLTKNKSQETAKFYARMESLLKQLLSEEALKGEHSAELFKLVEEILSGGASDKALRGAIIQSLKGILFKEDADGVVCNAIIASIGKVWNSLDEDSSAIIIGMIEEGLNKNGKVKERMESLSNKNTAIFVDCLLNKLSNKDHSNHKNIVQQLKGYYAKRSLSLGLKKKIVRAIAESHYLTDNDEAQSATKDVLVEMASLGEKDVLVMEMMMAATELMEAEQNNVIKIENRLALLLDQISKNEYQYKTSKGFFAQIWDYFAGNTMPDLKEQMAQHRQVLVANGANPEVAAAINKSLLNLEEKGLRSDNVSLRKESVASIGRLLDKDISNGIKQEKLNLLNSIVDRETDKKVLREMLEALGKLTLRQGNGDVKARQTAIEIAVKIMKKGERLYWWYNDTAVVAVLRNIDKNMFADEKVADQFRADVERYRRKVKNPTDDFVELDQGAKRGDDNGNLTYAYNVLKGVNTGGIINKFNEKTVEPSDIVRILPDKGKNVNRESSFSGNSPSFNFGDISSKESESLVNDDDALTSTNQKIID